jgi:hypothetical protein
LLPQRCTYASDSQSCERFPTEFDEGAEGFGAAEFAGAGVCGASGEFWGEGVKAERRKSEEGKVKNEK